MHVVVGLSLHPSDEYLIRFIRSLNIFVSDLRLTFVHVHKPLNIPENIQEHFPELKDKIDGEYLKKMVDEALVGGKDHKVLNYKILEGDLLKEMIEISKRQEVDLVLIGNHALGNSPHLMLSQFVRKSLSNVMILPVDDFVNLKEVVIATDFHAESKKATQTAIALARLLDLGINFWHVYQVPSTYYKTGKSYAEFAQIMKRNAEKEMADYLSTFNLSGLNVSKKFVLSEEQGVAEKVVEQLEEGKDKLLVLGSKGRSSMSSLILGSVAEKLLALNHSRPMLICKNEKENLGFWEALGMV